MKLIFLLSLCTWVAFAQDDERKIYDLSKAHEYFEETIVKYQRNYTEEEIHKRFQIFKERLKKYNELNALNESVFGITRFTDLTADEIGYNCFVDDDDDDDETSPTCEIVTDAQLSGNPPPVVDFRKSNLVTSVKNQGDCNTCWAFANIGVIEGAYADKHRNLLDFSPKQLMDCLPCSGHCEKGSSMRKAFRQLIGTPGVELDKDYPYIPKDTPCIYNATKAKVKVISCKNFRLLEEEKLKIALAQTGPIGIAIRMDDAIATGFKRGIITVKECPLPKPPQKVNHAVLLVGYGKENGKYFWEIKNSYGPEYGENGFMRLEMGYNVCGLRNNYTASANVQ